MTKNLYFDFYGVELPHNSYQQSRAESLEYVPTSVDALEPTDLLFFTNNSTKINHVGIYIADGNFLHTIPEKGVIVSNINSIYWKSRLVASKRLKYSLLAKAQAGGSFPVSVAGNEILSSQNFSLGYSSSPGSRIGINIDTFFERNLFAEDDTSMWPVSLSTANPDDKFAIAVETWQGVRASADIRPLDSLLITSSFSIIDAPSWGEGRWHIWQAYGIEAAIFPQGSDWSLALSLRSLLNSNPLEAYPGFGGADLGIRFNYCISDALRFSVSGTWEGLGAEQDGTSVLDYLTDVQDVSFNLGFSF